jgi:hypothetical protein
MNFIFDGLGALGVCAALFFWFEHFTKRASATGKRDYILFLWLPLIGLAWVAYTVFRVYLVCALVKQCV